MQTFHIRLIYPSFFDPFRYPLSPPLSLPAYLSLFLFLPNFAPALFMAYVLFLLSYLFNAVGRLDAPCVIYRIHPRSRMFYLFLLFSLPSDLDRGKYKIELGTKTPSGEMSYEERERRTQRGESEINR